MDLFVFSESYRSPGSKMSQLHCYELQLNSFPLSKSCLQLSICLFCSFKELVYQERDGNFVVNLSGHSTKINQSSRLIDWHHNKIRHSFAFHEQCIHIYSPVPPVCTFEENSIIKEYDIPSEYYTLWYHTPSYWYKTVASPSR